MSISPRLNLHDASPKSMEELMSFQEFVSRSELDPLLLELVRIHVSRVNGCAIAMCRHLERARALGEREQRLYLLPVWRQAPLYSERERAALAWSEAVIRVGADVPDRDFLTAREWFTEEELVELTMVIVAANAWNRIAVSFRHGSSALMPKVMG